MMGTLVVKGLTLQRLMATKWLGKLSKSCSKCHKNFKVYMAILWTLVVIGFKAILISYDPG